MPISSGGSGAPLGNAVGKITIDANGVKSGVSQALSALGQLQTVAVTVGAALGAAVVAGTAAAGAALGALGIKAIQAGSDVEEMMGKYSVVFGQFANSVAGDLTNLANEVGRNKYELMGFASTFQDTFVPLGFARGEAANLSTQLTQLTVDLASFNNVAEPQVLADLQSAIVGNHETMRKYGVIITETTLNQQLLNMGIEGGMRAATEQEKVMARLAIIMAGTTDAQGDAARTSESFANQLRALKSSIQETVQSIGMNLLPLAKQFISAFRAIEPALSTVLAGIFAMLRNLIEVGLAFIESFANAMGIDFDNLAGSAETWGSNIVTMLANGMAAAASAVISVLQDLASVIAYWLAPGSPPRLLPDLPEWGASAMSEFMNGWSSGDFSVFDSIKGTVEGLIRDLGSSMPKIDVINSVIGSQEAIAQAVEQMRTVGSVSAETMNAIVAGTGPAEEALRSYIEAMLQMEGAAAILTQAQSDLQAVQDITAENFREWSGEISQSLIPAVNAYRHALAQIEGIESQLSQAEERLQAIQSASIDNYRQIASALRGNLSPAMQAQLNALRELEQANIAYEQAQARVNRITEEYDAMLAPLNAQLQALRDAQTASKEAEELARLNEDINSGWLTGAELQEAIAQRDAILLQQRIRNLQRERDAAVGAAKDEMDAAEDAKDAAEEKAEATRQAALDAARAEVAALEEARDAAIAAAEAQREAMIAAAESQVEIAQAQVDALDEQIARNNAIIEQLQEQARLQEELKDAIEAAAKAGGGGGSGGAKPKVGGAGGIKPPGIGGPDGGSIFDRLKDAMGGDNMKGRFDDIFKNVGDIFGPVKEQAKDLGKTWADTVDTIEKAWARVQKRFAEFKDNFKFDDMGAKLQPLMDGLEPIKTAFGNVFSTIKEKVALFGQFIAQQVEKVKTWAAENEGLISNFLGIVGTIVGGIVMVVSFIYTNLAGIFDIVLVIIDGVITQILNYVTLFMQVVTGDWAGAWETVKTIIFDALMNAQNLLGAFFNWIAGIFGSSWEEITTTLDGWAANLTAIFQMLGVRISEGWNALWTGVSLTVQAIWQYITEWWNTFWGNLTTTLTDIGTAISEGWNALWTGVSLTAQAIWTVIKEWITTKVTEVKTAVETKVTEIKAWWETTWGEIKTKATTIWTDIKTAVETKVGEVKTAVETKINEVKTWWATTWGEIKTKVETIWAEVKTAVETKLTEIKTLIETKVTEAQNWIGDQVANFKGVGTDIINGLKEGAQDAAQGLIDAVTGVVNDAIAAAKSLLGIASPSRVFMQLGKFAGEGLAIGLTNSTVLAVNSAKKMAGAVIEAVKPVGGVLNNAMSDTRRMLVDSASAAAEIAKSKRQTVFDMVNWVVGDAAANNMALNRPAMSPTIKPNVGYESPPFNPDAGKKETNYNWDKLVLPNVQKPADFMRELTDLDAAMGIL